jgi:drug/metabolite transporter (DMT)-like permease
MQARTAWLASLAMIAFAANSLLCRAALAGTEVDASTFTLVRIVSGAFVLALLLRARGARAETKTGWLPALALFGYAATFSYAYLGLSTATGALILFGSVQATMIGRAAYAGERFGGWQVAGFGLAFAGFVALLLPGATAPHWLPAGSMIAAGVFWGAYSLAGRGAADPLSATATNFARAILPAAVLSVVTVGSIRVDPAGVAYAVASGALASGLGYVIWYAAVRGLRAGSAAIIQLSVPFIAALGGVVLLDEALSLRLVIASAALIGGIAGALLCEQRHSPGSSAPEGKRPVS